MLGLLLLLVGAAAPFGIIIGAKRIARRVRRRRGAIAGCGRARPTSILTIASVLLPLLTFPAMLLMGVILHELGGPQSIPRPSTAWTMAVAAPALGLIAGIAALVRAELRSQLTGSGGTAEAGIVLSSWACVAVVLLLPVWQRDEDRMFADICRSNVNELAAAARRYASDHGGAFPAADRWCDEVAPYLERESAFVCPERPELACGYAMNGSLSDVADALASDRGEVVIVFESDAGWNAAGGPELLPTRPRHFSNRCDIYATALGASLTVERKVSDADWLRWEP